MSAPLVSIVIPAYNPEFFQGALNCALSQTYPNIEVIVCDDSNSEHIERIFNQLTEQSRVPARYQRNPQRLGFVGNLLQGLSQATGEFIKFLCDDDLLFVKAVEAQACALAAHHDASLVVSQRTFCDAQGVDLPARFENTPLAPDHCLLKGNDVLAVLETFPTNFLGNLSSTLMRRADAAILLPALTQPDHCFAALLDFALFVCLLNRGHLLVLNQILAVERLHPKRLSHQQSTRDVAKTENAWLRQMLQARGGEPPPAAGWVHMVRLSEAAVEPRAWEELALSRDVGTRQRGLPEQVGTNSQDAGELYREWLACRTLTPGQLRLLPDATALWPTQPSFVVVVLDLYGDHAGVEASLSSLASQHYAPRLVVVLSSEGETSWQGENVVTLSVQEHYWAQLNGLLVELEGADWIYLLHAGDCPVDAALLVMADRVAHSPQAQCIYGDEGGIEAGESVTPIFKPDFNLDLLRSYPYVGRTLALRREAVLEAGGFNAEFAMLAPIDLLWRLFETGGSAAIRHVGEVLVESRLTFGEWLALPQVAQASAAVVAAHLQRLGIAHQVTQPGASFINNVQYLHAQRPLVSIIVVSCDQLAALQRCVERILANTAYAHFELVLVDNGGETQAAREWLAAMAALNDSKLRVLTCAAGPMAEVLNWAVPQARGSHIVVASPYLIATQAHWLDEMLQHALRPEVGAVGPLLFNAAGNVVHAGLILGPQGSVGGAFRGEALNASGYMARLWAVQNLSAVGADCLLFRRELFDELRGFDAQRFPDAAYEVDFCLRMAQSGFVTVWTPYAKLALGVAPVDAFSQYPLPAISQALQERWLPILARDPAYSQNMSLEGALYGLNPGLRRGWSPFSLRQLPNILGMPVNASASGHYRMIQPFLELETAGIAMGRIGYAKPTVMEIERQQPDVIIFQGRYIESSPREISDIRRNSSARLIYELDDYPLEVPSKNAHVRKRVANIKEIVSQSIAACDRMVVSTQALADIFAPMHDDIRVAPNMLSQHLWSNLRSLRQTSRKPRVGWGGGTSHTGDLELIAEVVRQLADEVDWIFFGMCPELLRPYIKEFHGLQSMDAYPAKLASLNLDLALAPLEFHIFNDCKSNLRLLEYGACGYPVICTDTLAYKGYLPCTRIVTNSTEEWIAAIRQHLADPAASYRQGDALREAVLRDYMLRGDNLHYWADAWLAP